MSTIRQLLSACRDLDRLDAEVLLAEVLGKGRAWLYTHDQAELKPQQSTQFQAWVARRRSGEPIAYLIGWREFWSLRLRVTHATLIPRPETELLVEQALGILPQSMAAEVLDLGTGSGAIALAIASERPAVTMTATDNCPQALRVAQQNAQQLGLDQVRFLQGSWYQPLAARRFDLIVSNPPYVADTDPHLERGDVAHEPRSALTPGGDGLAAGAAIIGGAPACLKPGGHLLLEHGLEQRQPLSKMLDSAGFELVKACDDLAGLPRVLVARLRTDNR